MNAFLGVYKAINVKSLLQTSLRRFSKMQVSEYQSASINYEKWTKRQLIKKIMELERINDGSSSQTELLPEISNNNETITSSANLETKPISLTRVRLQKKQLVFSEANTRLIGLKFSYLGWNYQGLAIQKEETALPTVEQKIIDALHHVKLIPTTETLDCSFSRCGRTDKGVSAMNQVVSLKVRSALTPEERTDPVNDAREIDYINILNQIVPQDIRFHAVCLRPPPDFDARFSCQYRHYKYIFDSTGLDLKAMEQGAKLFEGGHDFRNFCKVDGAKQLTNFKREIYSAKIEPLEGGSDPKFYVLDLKGKAFLWHQVRCMVAILLMVGQNLESPAIVSDMLDISKYPRKPEYVMANDLPLILYDCVFSDDVVWIPTKVGEKASRANNNFKGSHFDYNLKSMIFEIMYDVAIKPFDQVLEFKLKLHHGDGKGRFVNKNIPIHERKTIGTPEEINEKWRLKHIKRKNESASDDEEK